MATGLMRKPINKLGARWERYKGWERLPGLPYLVSVLSGNHIIGSWPDSTASKEVRRLDGVSSPTTKDRSDVLRCEEAAWISA